MPPQPPLHHPAVDLLMGNDDDNNPAAVAAVQAAVAEALDARSVRRFATDIGVLLLLGGLGAFSAVSSGLRLYNWATEAPPPPPTEFHRPFTEEQVRQLGEVHNVKDVRESLERFSRGQRRCLSVGLGHIILEEQDLTTRDRVQERLARFGWMFGGAENFDHLLSAGRLEASKLRLLAIEMDRRSRRYSQECGVEEEYPEDGGGEDEGGKQAANSTPIPSKEQEERADTTRPPRRTEEL